jgi:hypothetical protein
MQFFHHKPYLMTPIVTVRRDIHPFPNRTEHPSSPRTGPRSLERVLKQFYRLPALRESAIRLSHILIWQYPLVSLPKSQS